MKKENHKIKCNNDCLRTEKTSGIIPEIDMCNQKSVRKRKPALLLHSCCGPCSTAVVEQLIYDYDVTIFFYNPNITDRDEYLKRKDSQINFIERYNMNPERPAMLRFIDGNYDPKRFYNVIKGLESEPEGGDRCTACFRLRLEESVAKALLSGFDVFTTTLSVSPHKNFELISKIGNELSMRSGLPFLVWDFKKKNGFRRSVELSAKYGLYRQKYCGCEFSK